MNHPETVHGLVCIGKSGNKIRDEYLYTLVCPYCESVFEATHTQVKPKTGRKLGKNHCGCQSKLRRGVRKGVSPSNKLDDRTRTINQQYGVCRASANAKGFECTLTHKDIEELIFSDCFFCGETPSRVYTLGQGEWTRDSVPVNGIDRIDSSSGYVSGNVLPCCTYCNYLKKDRNQDEFLLKIKQIYENLGLNQKK